MLYDDYIHTEALGSLAGAIKDAERSDGVVIWPYHCLGVRLGSDKPIIADRRTGKFACFGTPNDRARMNQEYWEAQ